MTCTTLHLVSIIATLLVRNNFSLITLTHTICPVSGIYFKILVTRTGVTPLIVHTQLCAVIS